MQLLLNGRRDLPSTATVLFNALLITPFPSSLLSCAACSDLERITHRFECLLERIPIVNLALPYSHNAPAEFPEQLSVCYVTADVSLKLLLPEFGPGFRAVRVATPMTVPKTAVNENRNAIFRHNYIRLSWKVPIMETETVSHSVQRRT
jgi:hypothetical protein